MLSEPKETAPEPILEGQAWDRFDALGRPSSNDRNLRTGDGWSRRLADIADRGSRRLNWAESGPTPDGRNGQDCGRTRPPRSASCPPKRKSATNDSASWIDVNRLEMRTTRVGRSSQLSEL